MDALKRNGPILVVLGLLVVALFFFVKLLLPILVIALVIGAWPTGSGTPTSVTTPRVVPVPASDASR